MTTQDFSLMQLTAKQRLCLGNLLQRAEGLAEALLTHGYHVPRAQVERMRNQWLAVGVLLDRLEETSF